MEILESKEITAQVETVALPPGSPAEADLNKVALYVERSVKAIRIKTPDQYTEAATELQDLQGKLKALEEQRTTITKPLDASKKAVMNLFRGPTDRIEAAIATLKQGMLAFQREEAAKRAEEQRKADEEARQERIRQQQELLAQQAERERKQREAAELRRKQVEAEQAAIQAAAAGNREAEEKAAEEALRMEQEQARLDAEAEAARQAEHAAQLATMVSAPALVENVVPQVKGISTAKSWTAELVDDTPDTKMKLLKFVLENPQYINFIEVDMKPIKQMAKALKNNCQIPGIRVFEDETIRSRRS